MAIAVAEGMWAVEACFEIVQECRRSKDGRRARATHLQLCNTGLEAHPALGNHLVPMLVECDALPLGHQLFHRLCRRNEHSWTSLMHGYVESGDYQLALDLFPAMQRDRVPPGGHTYATLLKACTKLKDLHHGQELHALVVSEMLESDSVIGNNLITLYFKCESLVDARAVFEELPVRTIVSWNALVGGYAEVGLGKEALECLEGMQRQGLSPDEFTYVSFLKACGIVSMVEKGQELHARVVEQGYEGDNFVGNALVDMYANCGLLIEAHGTFEQLWVQDLVSWTALIVGYAEQGEGLKAHKLFEELQSKGLPLDIVLWSGVMLGYAKEGRGDAAFTLFGRMQEQGILPNRVTFLNILKACSQMSSNSIGNRIYSQLINSCVNEPTESTIHNTLVDMCGKCGNLSQARDLFDMTPTSNIVRWNALMMAYARQGNMEEVFELFEKMKEKHIRPDEVTLLSLLTACCHAGLVSKGLMLFEAMNTEFSLHPSFNHFNCMLDLLGRAGQLHEAVLMLRRSFSSDFVGWCILLTACRKWGDVVAGKEAFASILKLNIEHVTAYIEMSYIYSDANMWEEAKKVDAMRLRLQEGCRELAV
ncbi:hypothetical protein GOP47_0022155 [Adiantum capillus-veneris]|uniref:Pentatricopeptide repeat-containing protein n=1 Tax=Adiantum capillus-veneris TaxID=13818 RepID=A0A9D4Z5W9_ADICA|nr:hypothetical protein GOP47_0022155 [Adiantum capillus-veneris]